MDLKEVDVLGAGVGDHWYYASKASAIRRFLGAPGASRILDVGAGSGFFSKHLLERTQASEAWCVDTSYADDTDGEAAGKPIHFRRSVDRFDADLVLLMDVLEHVDDDVGLLMQYVKGAPSGSRFLITVPAFQFLWSGHDDFLEHKRRYTLGGLEDVVRRAGLDVEHGAYYFGLTFPLAAALRLGERARRQSREPVSQLRRHHPFVNGLLKTICRIELPMFRFNRVAGLTVICVARKQ
ncbi:methyltransferase [Burkholderia aenigmatica]|uniref:Methyltransferase n=1 Tax=Burkholderia aenigmatica TaxID=2015348 RepID=A0A6J5JJY4_9BURK|nr:MULTISPECIES: methyltransferase domain-containing protein [Burkholderia]AYQ38213.1 methyltransferase [Burkholderia lata]CAB3972049.1 methyltransferase [Burkholderia aenigmatica]VWC53880.1 methyltransferase [Burkholderia aenigmatica]